jgi:predicted nucleic acid-binding protein
MTIKLFIDTGAFVAYHNKDDKNHEKATEIFKDIAKDKFYTKLITSDYIIDEAVTTCRVRTKRHDLSVLLGETILNSESISTIKINEYIFSAAWELYKKYKDVDLSFTDCTIVIIMNLYDINQIFSFDEHFDVFKFSRIS